MEQVGWGLRLLVIKIVLVFPPGPSSNLNVSRIMVKRTNLPRRGTTREVGGIISARRRKNTVRESRMEMDSETWTIMMKVVAMIMIVVTMVLVMRESRMEMESR